MSPCLLGEEKGVQYQDKAAGRAEEKKGPREMRSNATFYPREANEGGEYDSRSDDLTRERKDEGGNREIDPRYGMKYPRILIK